MSAVEELQKMRLEIEKTKAELNRLEGQKETHLHRLKTEFGIDSVEKAQSRIQELEKRLEDLEEQLKNGLEKIKAKYDFGEMTDARDSGFVTERTRPSQ